MDHSGTIKTKLYVCIFPIYVHLINNVCTSGGTATWTDSSCTKGRIEHFFNKNRDQGWRGVVLHPGLGDVHTGFGAVGTGLGMNTRDKTLINYKNP